MEETYLEWIELINFQSHAKTLVHFVKGTNVLAGSSQNGKSAIIRALIFNTMNQPTGASKYIVKIGQKETTVRTGWSNNKIIERVVSRSGTNVYRLYEGTREDHVLINEYTGFGRGVPSEIQEAHGMYPMANGTYFQFGHQLESAFMFNLSASQKADMLGNLDAMAKVDEELTKINQDILNENKEKKRLAEQETELTEELEKAVAEQKRLKEKVATLKVLKEGVQSKQETLLKMQNLLTDIVQKEIEINKAETMIKKATFVIENWNPDLETKHAMIIELTRYIQSIERIDRELSQIRFVHASVLDALSASAARVDEQVQKYKETADIVKRLEKVNSEIHRTNTLYSEQVASLSTDKLDVDITRFRGLFKELERLTAVESDIKKVNEQIEVCSQKVEQLLEEFTEALHEVKICPTCGQETSHLEKEHVESTI